MTIATYSQLQTAITDFLNRDDLNGTARTFIALAEAQINRDVRHWKMERRKLAETSQQYLQRPLDWVETVRIHAQSDFDRPLQLVGPQHAGQLKAKPQGATGVPTHYCHSVDAFELIPAPSEVLVMELRYIARLEPLSDMLPSNWLLMDAPDVYLYGSLVHSAPYLKDDPRTQTWAALYAAAVQAVNNESENSQWSGSGLRLRVRGGP